MAKKCDAADIGLEEGVDALRYAMDNAEEIPFDETEDEREQSNGKGRRRPPPPFQPVSTSQRFRRADGSMAGNTLEAL